MTASKYTFVFLIISNLLFVCAMLYQSELIINLEAAIPYSNLITLLIVALVAFVHFGIKQMNFKDNKTSSVISLLEEPMKKVYKSKELINKYYETKFISSIRTSENDTKETFQENFKRLTNEVAQIKTYGDSSVIKRNDGVGKVSRFLVKELKDCFENKSDSLFLEFQPKMNANKQVVGAETLIRCEHPIIGRISPLVITKLCDEAGLTNELGSWVIKKAFHDIKEIHNKIEFELPVSINLDPKQLNSDENLINHIKNIIKESAINPQAIELEITENFEIDTSTQTLEKLIELKNIGIKISLDDFSMGHNSITFLNGYYVDTVKLDASLIKNIDSKEHLQCITESLINLCERLSISIIAEGVETKSEFEKLKELNCPNFQGYYFSRSLKLNELVMYVKNNSENIM